MSASASKHRAGVRATIPAVQEEEGLFRADAVNEEEEEEEEEEGLFKADAVNEEDPERDRATQV